MNLIKQPYYHPKTHMVKQKIFLNTKNWKNRNWSILFSAVHFINLNRLLAQANIHQYGKIWTFCNPQNIKNEKNARPLDFENFLQKSVTLISRPYAQVFTFRKRLKGHLEYLQTKLNAFLLSSQCLKFLYFHIGIYICI